MDSKSSFVNRIIRFSVYQPWVVLALTVLATLVGWAAYQKLPIDAVPDITNVQVQVNTPVKGLAPEEIERNVTFPVETAMSGIAGVTQIRSLTRLGLSQVTVVFEESSDIYRARQLVSERLQTLQGSVPEGIMPTLGPVTTGLGEIVHYTLVQDEPEGKPPTALTAEEEEKRVTEMRILQEWVLKPRLLTVKGVAEVNTIGGHGKQYHIQPDPEKLARYGLHFNDLAEALRATNQNVGGGYVQQTGEQFLVQAVGLLRSMDEIRRVPIKSLQSLRTVTIGDVAEVSIGKSLSTGGAQLRGKETVLGTVMMLLGENSRTVSERVVERLHEIEKTLPKGVKVKILYDRSELVGATLDTVIHNLIMGASLVVVVLLLLVGNVRAAAITAVTIPISLLMTFFVMSQFGISGNLMSLGALDFGIIVDGTVIVIDNIVRVLHAKAEEFKRSLSADEIKETIVDATTEIRSAAGFGQLIIVIVFLPIFGLTGTEGKMFRPMAMTFSIAIVSALLLSFTTVPALASLFMRGHVTDEEPGVMKRIRALYEPTLDLALRFWRRTIAAGAAAVVAGGLLFATLGGEFLPQLDEGSLVVQFIRPIKISLDQSSALQSVSEKLILEFPEVEEVFSRIGTAEVATDPMGVNESDTFVVLKEHDEWPKIDGRRRSKEELTNAIISRLNSEIPGQQSLASQPIQMRFNDLLGGTRADLSVKIFGDNLDQLGKIARQVVDVIQGIHGAGDVSEEQLGKAPVLRVSPRDDLLRGLGVPTREVLDTVGMALGGQEVGYLYEGFKRFPIVVRLKEEDRKDLQAIRALPVGMGDNGVMALSEAASVQFSDTEQVIFREASVRRTAALINPRGRDTDSFVREAQDKVAAAVKLPEGYFMEWGGNFKNLREAKARLAILTPIALALVLLMIFAAFRDVAQTVLIFSCVPLALVGGVMGLVLNGLPFSISAGVGFIALSGIAVLNGVVLVNYFNELRASGMGGKELVKTGSAIRLRPVLMTALVDVFGFLPMMLSTGIGSEVQRPLASVVIGGILSSTLLTLIVLPVLYWLVERKRT